MEEHSGDGDNPEEIATEEAFTGAFLRVKDLKREDGILTRAAGTQQGVLQRAMTAVYKDQDYRQELKTAFFLSTDESDRVVAAINEALRYGCSLTPIVDWVVARSSGIHGSRLHAIFDTVSHITFTTNYAGKKKWWSNDRSRDRSSPISQ